jgi:hypothetical protein
MSEQIPAIHFLLTGIKTEQFATFEENFTLNQDINIMTQIELKVSQEAQTMGVFIRFDFMQAEKIILRIIVSCHFKIEPKSWESLRKDGTKMQISKELFKHLAMVTCGTARGILFAKTENTIFANIILPMLNLENLIKEDVLIDLH